MVLVFIMPPTTGLRAALVVYNCGKRPTASLDETNRHAVFEPVCTHPDHRWHGLASTLMTEGLHRLKGLGAADVSVDTGDMIPANCLYDSMGFTEVYLGHVWRKTF